MQRRVTLGHRIADLRRQADLSQEELAHRGEDRRAPGWHVDEIAPGTDFDVLIIGAGMSGILAAHRLQQAGVRFTIVEKDDDVGGTWLENTYPGCRVDNPNHNYSFSFAQRHDWPFHFSPQPVLLDYFQRCADAFGVREHVRFGTEVVYDDGQTVKLQGSSYLGRTFGTFYYNATVTNGCFNASYTSCKDNGTFRLTKCCN